MVFSSLTFLCIFLPITTALYYLVRPINGKNIILVIASLVFYAYGEPVYIILMLGSIAFNYFIGRLIGEKAPEGTGWLTGSCDDIKKEWTDLEKNSGYQNSTRRKAVLAAGIAVNLCALCLFKYAGWVQQMIFTAFNIEGSVLSINPPIGISFYTFQAMSYLIDLYRGECRCQKSIVKFCLYISMFAQLIAGPIVKYHDIEDAIYDRSVSPKDAAEGLRRFIIGLGKKVLIANVLAGTADAVYGMDLSLMNSASAWIGGAAYMFQIYFDFSGYSDMAIGLGKMFGFRIPENFNYPYISGSVKEFWRRWHISMSTWFKEYLYFSLGGNRKGRARTYFNKIFVFLCTGLWHGANVTFVVWGLTYAVFLVLEDLLPVKKLPSLIRHVYTVFIVFMAWVIFRADDLTQASAIMRRMFTGFGMGRDAFAQAAALLTPGFITALIVSVIAAGPLWRKLVKPIENRPSAVTLSYIYSAAVLVLCVLYLSGGGYNPFLYFRF